MQTNSIILKPVVTEKASQMAGRNIYAFVVDDQANKQQIAQTLTQLYKVKIGDVRIVHRQGKIRRVGRRMQTKKLSDRKIAYVEVKEGKIDLFPQA